VVAISSLAFVLIKAANAVIRSECCRTAHWLSKMQDPKSVLLHWCSFLGWGNEYVTCLFPSTAGHWLCFGSILLLNPSIDERSDWNRWRNIDAYRRDLLTVIRCAVMLHKIHLVVINSQYTIFTNHHLHPKVSRPLTFWATTIHIIYLINDLNLSSLSMCGRQLTA